MKKFCGLFNAGMIYAIFHEKYGAIASKISCTNFKVRLSFQKINCLYIFVLTIETVAFVVLEQPCTVHANFAEN